MATILDRFKKLGIPRSNQLLSIIGDKVSIAFLRQNQDGTIHGSGLTRQYIDQTEEDGKEYCVWNYCEAYTPIMDKLILGFIQGGKQNG